MHLLCFTIRYCMQLVFFLGNDLIEAVQLDPELISKPGYLGQFKRTMRSKYQYLISEAANLPEFLVMPFTTTGRTENQQMATA